MNRLTFMVQLCVALLPFFGCSTSERSTTRVLYSPRFEWTPPSKSAVASADVSLAVVAPLYATKDQWVTVPLFRDFSRSLGRSFEELLVAKGFTIRGPFDDREAMTYPDKKGSDLIIYPSLEITLDGSNFKTMRREKINILGPNYTVYSQSGEIVVGGRVALIAMESLSGEKMWTKNIALESTRLTCDGEKEYRSAQEAQNDNTDPGVMNPMAKALETYYGKILQTAWDYINTEEMQLVKKKSEEIRTKKVY